MRFKRTLETILAGIITLAICAMPKKAKAAETVIIPSDGNNVKNTTISENWVAWEDSNDIVALYRPDPNLQYNITVSGNASAPNLDEENLVYEENDGIVLYDLGTMSGFTVYYPLPGEECSNPKINGRNIVFKFKNNKSEEILSYNIDEWMVYPLTNSSNSKRNPDIYGCTAVWCELDNKADSNYDVNDLLSYGERSIWPDLADELSAATEPNSLLDGEDWDAYMYDFSTGIQSVIDNEPNMSTDSIAIYGGRIVYSWNTIKEGPTGIMILYYQDPNLNARYRKSLPGPRGSIHNIRLHKNVASWTRKWARFRYQPPFNNKDRIEAMYVLPIGIKSDGYRINDEGGRQFGSDSFKNTAEDYIVSYATTDSNFPSASASSMSASSVTDPYSSEPTSAAVIKTFRNALWWDLGEIFDNWLKVKPKGALFNPRGDFNNDKKVNLLDFATRIKAEQDLSKN